MDKNQSKTVPDMFLYLKGSACKNEISKEHPYNETDAVIFSALCYLEFEKITKASIEGEVMTIGAYAKLFQNTRAYRRLKSIPIAYHNNIVHLSKSMAFNIRYSNLIVTNIRSEFDKDKVVQFMAMTILLPDTGNGKEKVVVFRGTDESVHGWIEDILLAYAKEETHGQNEAKEYLNQIEDVDNLYLTGHSKGGHLAEYGAVFCHKNVQEKIKSIINIDGPGVRRDVKELYKEGWTYLSNRLGKNWYSLLPPSSVVGVVLSEPESIYLVQSNKKALMQHDMYTWKFTEEGIVVTSGELDEVSKKLNIILKDAMENVSAQDILNAFDPKYVQDSEDSLHEKITAIVSINKALTYAVAKNLGILFEESLDEKSMGYWNEAKLGEKSDTIKNI